MSDFYLIFFIIFLKASVSPVFESIIERPRKKNRSSERVIRILGVPRDAVVSFVRFLYSSRLAPLHSVLHEPFYDFTLVFAVTID